MPVSSTQVTRKSGCKDFRRWPGHLEAPIERRVGTEEKHSYLSWPGESLPGHSSFFFPVPSRASHGSLSWISGRMAGQSETRKDSSCDHFARSSEAKTDGEVGDKMLLQSRAQESPHDQRSSPTSPGAYVFLLGMFCTGTTYFRSFPGVKRVSREMGAESFP